MYMDVKKYSFSILKGISYQCPPLFILYMCSKIYLINSGGVERTEELLKYIKGKFESYNQFMDGVRHVECHHHTCIIIHRNQ